MISGEHRRAWTRAVVVTALVVTAAAVPTAASADEHRPRGWSGWAGDAQHTGQAPASPQPLHRIRWKVKVDRDPSPPQGEVLGIHYGSPMVTPHDTVVVPTKRAGGAGFAVVAYAGKNGARRWSLTTDYMSPPTFEWTPPLPATLTRHGDLVVAGAGGTILVRSKADRRQGSVTRRSFYGVRAFRRSPAAYRDAVHVTTPITAADDGSVYFGVGVSGDTPKHLAAGIARVDDHGRARFVTAAAAVRAPSGVTDARVPLNAAPALSPDGRTVYVPVVWTDPTSFASLSSLVALDARTLRPLRRAALKAPDSGEPVFISESSSASPTVGPDGDVYFGVLENPFPFHNDRGWLLHFDGTLRHRKLPGSFGWDNTVSVLPARSLPAYHGKAPYLLVSKDNNYDGFPTGDGHNRVSVFDPTASRRDPYAQNGVARTMKPVVRVLGPTQFPGATRGSVYEWCINNAATDARTATVVANSEDGKLYLWDLRRNRISQSIRLNPPRPEAYTPTVIGPDGTVYAINDSTLYAVGR